MSGSIRARYQGFTLVELVLVIALSGIVMTMGTVVLSRPMESFIAQSRRVHLVGEANLAINQVAAQLRQAIPGTPRVVNEGGGVIRLEFLKAAAVGRYQPTHEIVDGEVVAFDPPRCTASPCRLDVSLGSVATDMAARWALIKGRDELFAWNGYANPGQITPAGSTLTLADDAEPGQALLIGGAAGFAFAAPGLEREIHLVQEVVGLRCAGAGVQDGQGVGALQGARFDTLSTSAAGYAASGAVLVGGVSRCAFSYQHEPERGDTLTVELEFTRDGEVITLQRSVRLAPVILGVL